MDHRRTLNQRGLSLVELLVVVGITIAMLAVALPVAQSGDLAGSEARRFLADAMRARSAARARWEPTQIRVVARKNMWKLETSAGEIIPGPGADELGRRFLADGVHFKKITNYQRDFIFLPNGRTLRNASIYIQSGDSTWKVTGSALSGMLESEPVETPP